MIFIRFLFAASLTSVQNSGLYKVPYSSLPGWWIEESNVAYCSVIGQLELVVKLFIRCILRFKVHAVLLTHPHASRYLSYFTSPLNAS